MERKEGMLTRYHMCTATASIRHGAKRASPSLARDRKRAIKMHV